MQVQTCTSVYTSVNVYTNTHTHNSSKAIESRDETSAHMDAPLVPPSTAFISTASGKLCGGRSSRPHPCLSKPITCGIAEPSGEPAPMGHKTKYKDSLFDRAFMSLFARKMANVTGTSRNINGYEDFVDVSREVMKGRNPAQQQEAVRKVLLSILPPGAPETFRKLFPPTKWSAEINAAITVPFFYWLVGPSELVEVEVNGVKQKSGVRIKKCRYIEYSGCVGMCVNMCKLPTQDFFTNDFGLPLTMNPNFEDMSCEMIYGQQPPPLEEDPAFKQPCFSTLCPVANDNSPACPKTRL